ncbi:hypothetical protein [Sinomonas sp.]|uniref:hypothetical protein n=1 Tax=Sinomonas sp. TaxID=1914986 RepID=UPI003F81C01B
MNQEAAGHDDWAWVVFDGSDDSQAERLETVAAESPGLLTSIGVQGVFQAARIMVPDSRDYDNAYDYLAGLFGLY